jgi:hypothetical protein
MQHGLYVKILWFIGRASRYIPCNESQIDALFILSLFRQSSKPVPSQTGQQTVN